MAKQNGFEIAPYFERQGLAAQGAADEWMDYARKTADQHLKTLDPNVRNRVAPQLTNYLSENYQRLKLFEAREVRRGKLQKLETDVERRIGALASGMAMEADSTARNDALNMADVENAYAADSRRIAAIADENERAREQSAADERRKVQTEAIAQSRAEREEAGFARMMRDIQDGEKLLDDAVAEGVMDDETARVRKLQASGAAISGTIAALADKGHFDLAEGFVSRLERPGVEGLPSVGLAYGVYPDSIARLRDRIRIGRNRVEAERAAADREAKAALGRKFDDAELRLRDVPEELWPDEYERMGRDPSLRALDPKRALSYMDEAQRMKGAIAKAKVKAVDDAVAANERDLQGRLADLSLLASSGLISDDDIAKRQGEIWRDFAAAALGKAVGEGFKESFPKKFGAWRDARKAQAMRYVADLFGWKGQYAKDGTISAADRRQAEKDGLEFYTPFETKGWFTDGRATIEAVDLWPLLDSIERNLDANPDKSADPVSLVKESATKFKAGWTENKMQGMIDAAAEGMAEKQLKGLEERIADISRKTGGAKDGDKDAGRKAD